MRGDTLLDMAIRNGASTIFKGRIRALGGNSMTLRKQDAFERKQACRQAELQSMEGILLILPPGQVAAYLRAKERAVSAASKAAASSALAQCAPLGEKPYVNAAYEAALERNAAIIPPSWQKRHFCFIPEGNTLEGMVPFLLADNYDRPEFCFSPMCATTVDIKGKSEESNNDSFSLTCPRQWYPFECTLQQSAGRGGERKPVCFAAPSPETRMAWQKAINNGKKSAAAATSKPQSALWYMTELKKLRWKLVCSTSSSLAASADSRKRRRGRAGRGAAANAVGTG